MKELLAECKKDEDVNFIVSSFLYWNKHPELAESWDSPFIWLTAELAQMVEDGKMTNTTGFRVFKKIRPTIRKINET